MKPVRCAIYTRKSSDEGLEQDFNSLHAQREACEAYIASQAGEGWTASRARYDDGGLSGGTLERAGLQALIADVERGQVDIVIVYKVDRLTRSLLDFAKLVETFDTHDVSFVSVTQSFNTTSSMGRLTLNMLLSFAQFEREVTAERIRDKLAASRKKGMWMGGIAPIGYAPDGRTLQIVERDAALVRHIFALYLELGTVRAVATRLEADGITTPVRTMHSTGRQFGGNAFSRGQIYRILSNPIYIGEIASGDERWPGLHQAIIDRDIWAKVQALRSGNAHAHRSKANASDPSLLAGILFDEHGQPMVPTHTTKKGRRYRYYASRPLQQGEAGQAQGMRIPAREVEQLICSRLADLFEDPLHLASQLAITIDAAALDPMRGAATRQAKSLRGTRAGKNCQLVQSLVARVEIAPARVDCKLRGHAMADAIGLEVSGPITNGTMPDTITISIPARLKRNGKTTRFALPGQQPANQREPDPVLTKALGRAHRWWNALAKDTCLSVEDLARQEGKTSSYITRIVRLAFLKPELTEAILRGEQRVDLDLAALMALAQREWTGLPHQ